VARALVGSEGTCVSILQARVNLIDKPAFTRLIVLGFDDIFLAGDAVEHIMPFKPIAMEGLDWGIVGGLNDRNLRQKEIALLPEGHAWMLVELAAATTDTLEADVERFVQSMNSNALVKSSRSIEKGAQEAAIWSIREQGASATSMSLDPDGIDPVVGWEDTAVDPLQLGNYLREFKALVDRYGYTTSLYGHFGDGCIHARITFDTRSEKGVAHWRNFSNDIAHLVVRFGGSLSAEHGDGQAKAEFLPIMFGDELMHAFRRFKSAWDPASRMNPGKLIDAYRMDENLRFGPDYQTPIPLAAGHTCCTSWYGVSSCKMGGVIVTLPIPWNIACHAKPARHSAQPVWTLPATRRSSCTAISRNNAAHCIIMYSDASDNGYPILAKRHV